MNKAFPLIVALAAIIALGGRARADVQVEEGDDGLIVFRMTVTPAAAPVPALAHRLVLRELDVKPGNAAPFYYRTFAAADAVAKGLREKHEEQYDEWILDMPIAELPLEQVREAAGAFDQAVGDLMEATTRRDCQWDWQLEGIRGPELFSFLLPELQQSREMSRALCVRARLAIAEGQYNVALHELQINYKMARDMAIEPLLVNALVGVAEASMGHRAVIDLIGAPDSPNLFWALTELPDPFIDMRAAVRFEMSSAFRVFPFMIDAEQQEHSPEEWARLLTDGVMQLEPLMNGGPPLNEAVTRAGVTGMALFTYTGAKQRLIDGGMDADRIEQMPVGQVIAIDAGRQFRRLSDEFEKWWYVPYRDARDRNDDAEKLLGGSKFDGGYGHVLASLLLPALNAARTAQVRLQWQTGGIQTLEAIRMHAAETGELPASLDQIEVVTLPENPATGRPYQYRLDGETGVLDLPASDGFPSIAWRFEIKLAD
jgi:hypothetical protein